MKIKLKQMCRLINIQKKNTHLKMSPMVHIVTQKNMETLIMPYHSQKYIVFKTQEIKSNKKY